MRRAVARVRAGALPISGRGSARRRFGDQAQPTKPQKTVVEPSDLSENLKIIATNEPVVDPNTTSENTTSGKSTWIRTGKFAITIPVAGLLAYGVYQQMPSGWAYTESKTSAGAQNINNAADQSCSHFLKYIEILEKRVDRNEREHNEDVKRMEELNKKQSERILELEKARKGTFWPFF